MYVNMLAQRELMLRFNNQGVPRWEDRALRARLAAGRALRSATRSASARGSRSRTRPRSGGSSTSSAELLADGRPHLCGERFTAADLTFAALSASVIVPPVYGVPLPQPDVLPPDMAALRRARPDHPAGRYALALYASRPPAPA